MGDEVGTSGNASAYATGGGGVVLEHAYGGVLLAELLLGGPVAGLGDDVTPTAVGFQQSIHSPVDDLKVVGDGPGGPRTMFVGVRRKPSIGASQESTVKLVANYLEVVNDHGAELEAGSWRLGLAVAAPHTPTDELAKLAYFARRQPDPEAFRLAVNAPRATTGKVRNRLIKVDETVAAAAPLAGITLVDMAAREELSWRLLRSLHIIDLRLEGDDAAGRTGLVARLVPLAGDGAAAEDLRRHLNELSASYAVGAAVVNERILRRDLSGRINVAASPAFRASWEALQSLEDSLHSRTRRALTAGRADNPVAHRQLVVERHDTRTKLVEAMGAAGRNAGRLVVHGEPGVGKSALVLDAAEEIRRCGGAVVALSLRDLVPASTLTVGQLLHAPVRAVFAATAAAPVRLVILDGAEVVQEGAASLLRDLAGAAGEAGLGLVAVTRDDARAAVQETLVETVPAEERSGTSNAPAVAEVPPLADDETRAVRETFPELSRLASDDRSQWLLRRLGIIDVLLRGEAIASLPDGSLSEADVFGAVWYAWVRHRDQPSPGGASPDGREQAMLEFARRSLAVGSGSARAPIMADPYALPSLRSDGLLLPAGPQFAFRQGDEFSTDTVRDFALARLFLREGFDSLREAGAPRRALRAARLACQARLVQVTRSSPGPAAVGAALRELQQQFDVLAATFGDRWADLPWEAALSGGPAEAVIKADLPDLLQPDGDALSRVLRLLMQRFSGEGAADPVIAAPVVAFLVSRAEEISKTSYGLAEQAEKLIRAWLRGVSRAERIPGGVDRAARWRPLRAQVRDHLLRQVSPRSDVRLECLALLGADADAEVLSYLRDMAADQPGLLAPCVEPFDAMMSLAAAHLDLLFELTEAYYIERTVPYGGFAGFDDGIRRHRFGPGIGVPFASWLFGPFWLLLRTTPVRALALINRMLDHAALYRVRRHDLALPGQHQVDEEPESRQATRGVTVNMPGVGDRHYAGDDHVWAWYRGTSVGPYPCMSALLAVEQFGDQLLAQGILLPQLVVRLLHDAHNLAMLGLVTGLLTRHADQVTGEADPLLASPAIWQLEASRAAMEGGIHAAGRDDPQTPGGERRRWTLTDLAGFLVLNARLDNDQGRLDALREVGDTLIATAAALLPPARAAEPGPAGEEPAPAGARGHEDEAIFSVRRWASMLDDQNYQLGSGPEGITWEWHPPANIEATQAQIHSELDRAGAAYRLINTYCLQPMPPYMAEVPPLPPAETLSADAVVARDLLEAPPATGPPDKSEAPAAVAAALLRATAFQAVPVSVEHLEWAAGTAAWAVLNPPQGPMDFEGSLYGGGADRSAASALPGLLMPAFTQPASGGGSPLVDEDDLTEITGLLRTLTTSLFTEVRMITARSMEPIWAAPCGPGSAGTGGCRHTVAWSAVEDGARDVAMASSWTPSGRREKRVLDGPLTTALAQCPTEDLLLDRLSPPLIEACDAARSSCCVAEAAAAIRDGLLGAYARTAILWGEQGYEHRDEDQCAVAAALLAAAAADPQLLLGLAGQLAGQARALHETLRALSVVATYDAAARAAVRTTWPSIMDVILDAVDAGAEVFDDRNWGDYALAALIPSPTTAVSDPNPMAAMKAARSGWPTPEELNRQVERWLPHAAGQPHAADNLIGLLETLPLAEQARTGLPWVHTVIFPAGRGYTRGSWRAIEWLASLRDGHVLDATTRPVYDSLVDALVADNYRAALDLQRRDE